MTYAECFEAIVAMVGDRRSVCLHVEGWQSVGYNGPSRRLEWTATVFNECNGAPRIAIRAEAPTPEALIDTVRAKLDEHAAAGEQIANIGDCGIGAEAAS